MSKFSRSLGRLCNQVVSFSRNTIQTKTVIIGVLCLAGGGAIFGMKMTEGNSPLLADHSAQGDSGGGGNMGEWCAAWRSGGTACQDLCNQYGMSDTSCVSGCQNMTESMCDGSYSGGSTGGGTYNGGSSMQNCFYPNATINGAAPGYTVWCESDYVNCRQGDPSGASVSTVGLALGAPSQCDSGWSGGSTGGTTGGSTTGGSTGGSTTGGSTTGTTGGSTGPSAFDMCMDGCGLPRQATSEQKQANTCYASYCKSMDPTPPAGTSQTGTSSASGGDCALQCDRDIGTANPGKLGNCKNACAQGYLGGYMRNCFYPNATRNGSPLGFTPKCDEQSYTCKDHQNNPLNLNGVRLGSAGQCDDGGYGSTGGGMQGTGGMYCSDKYGPTGTRPSSGQCATLPCDFNANGVAIHCVSQQQTSSSPNGGSYGGGCVQGCTSMTPFMCDGQTSSSKGDMGWWCQQWRSGTCQQACDSGYGNTGTMPTGGYTNGTYGSGPVRCVYPNGVVLFCRSPHVDCSKTQGGSILTNQQVGANGATAQCDPVSGSTYNGDSYNNGSYNNSPYNNGMNSGYESTNTESRRQQLLWEVQDHERQANDMKMSAQESGVNLSAPIKEFLSAVSKAKSCINTATSGQALVECDQMLMKARELSGTLWNTIQRGHEDKNRQMWDRQLGEMENVIGQMAGADVSNLKKIFSELKAAVADANSISTNTNTTEELRQKTWQRVDDLQSKFWQEANAFRPGGNEGYGRGPAEACERMKAETQRADPSVQVKLKALVQECFGLVQKLTAGSAAGEGDMRQAMEGLMQKFGTIMSSSWQRSACDDARRGVDEARDAITTFAPMMVQKVRPGNPGVAAMLDGLLTTARSILARAEQALKSSDCDGAMKAMSEMDSKVRLPFEEAMAKAGFDMMDNDEEFTLVNYDAQYGEIYQRAGEPDAQYEDFARTMKEQKYGLGELNVLKTIDPKLMGIARKNEGAEVIKAATSANVDRVKLEELLAAKDAIITKLEAQVQNLQAGMATIVTRVARFTPHPSVANKLNDLVQRASTLTATQFEQEFAAIDAQTRTAAVEDGWTHYTDAYHFDPQQQWYAGAVNEMSDRGVFTGTDPQNHIFGAGQTANGAELVTVLARIVGMNEGAKPTSEYADNLPDWAASAGGTLDTLLPGSLDTYLSGEAGRGVTRMEIALLIADLFGDDLPETDGSIFENFQDAQQIPAYARKAIASVVAVGIITGQDRDGGKVFDPNGTVTREQLATILSRLLPLLEEEESDTPTGGAATAAPSSETDTEQAVEEEEKPAAPPAPAFNLASITKGEATVVYSLLLKEYSDIQTVMQGVSPEEKLSTWVPKLNDTKKAINAWEKLDIDNLFKPYERVPNHRLNVENLLLNDIHSIIQEIFLKPTAGGQES